MFTSFLLQLLASFTAVVTTLTMVLFGPMAPIENMATSTSQTGTSTIVTALTERVGEVASSTIRATTTPKKVTKATPIPKALPETKPKTETKPAETTTITVPFLPPIQTAPVPSSFTNVNASVRNAIVNILCTTKSGGSLNPISGSGLVIGPEGVILTNAHVAQYLLLKDYGMPNYVECVARTGSPARNMYTLELLYISPEWIANNKETLIEQNPTGTGEHDYALLRITGRTDPNLVVSFPVPFIHPEINEPAEGANVLVAGYPAGFLGGITIQKDLYSASAISTVKKMYTFDLQKGTADLMSVGGTVIAQKGSSGGTVVNANGDAIGLVVTSTDAEKTEDRDLRAITLAHVNRDLSENAGITLDSLLKSNLAAYARTFNTAVAPKLTKTLVDVLSR